MTTDIGVLKADVHDRLIKDAEHFCAIAGIQQHFLRESMTKYCGEAEVEWVRKFRKYKQEGMPGLVLEGIKRPDTRCQAMAGAFLRNFIDASVIPVNTLIDAAKDGSVPSPTGLFVPVVARFGRLIPESRHLPAQPLDVVRDGCIAVSAC